MHLGSGDGRVADGNSHACGLQNPALSDAIVGGRGALDLASLLVRCTRPCLDLLQSRFW